MNKDVKDKMAQLEIIGEMLDKLEAKKKEITTDFRIVGKEDEQATNWKTGELLWEDEEQTIPKMRDKWADVEIPEEEWTDEIVAKVNAITEIAEKLRKMI